MPFFIRVQPLLKFAWNFLHELSRVIVIVNSYLLKLCSLSTVSIFSCARNLPFIRTLEAAITSSPLDVHTH